MKKASWVALAFFVLAVQLAALGWVVARHERVMTRGTEVRIGIPCEWLFFEDMLSGRYLEAVGMLECGELEYTPRNRREKCWVLLEPVAEGVVSHRAARFAKEPGTEGLWVKVPWYDWKWDEQDDQDDDLTWDEETAKRGMPLILGFPGKLFMDRRLAKAAEGMLTGEGVEAAPVAVYRALGGAMVLVDVEIGGESIRALARRAMEEAEAESGPDTGSEEG